MDVLIVENVGNLVCPAEFRIGEDARIMVCSVTEGEDKPLKYPLMFRACELVVINKIDLLQYLDFDVDRLEANILQVNPQATVMRVSAKTGEGIEAFRDVAQGAARRASSRTTTTITSTASTRITSTATQPLARARRPRARHGVTQALGGRRHPPPRWSRPPASAPSASRRCCATAATPTRSSSTAEAERLAKLCHKMAERFAREGRLVAFGASPADRSDARHVAVEFVHPVIVGKRALPALGLAGEGGQIAAAGRARGRGRGHRDGASATSRTSSPRWPRRASAAA